MPVQPQPGAQSADRLSRMVVLIGAVHVHVPLVLVPGGFSNPTDAVLTCWFLVDVEPGRVEVQVVTRQPEWKRSAA